MTKQNKPLTEVLIDREDHQTLLEFATTLEKIAEKLKTEGSFTMVEGTKENVIQPSEQLEVEYKYEKKGDKHSFEIEFEWYTGEKASQTMTIE
ncbi:amphi-Trp domain-containing protein [Vagococcus acidifermentans]|uniref:Amphi-Trp domain-containing protein n=1 Tax=Vagococcus acidifermentans TaxID=564710 RepID=A0A430AR72_9ENTE|nr:amphi-Trp domain-containing protein [Vagococcus acidifermentans]RSU10437.1 amphi-Trp domain-containing protein [Vagococcus acidifermentans]